MPRPVFPRVSCVSVSGVFQAEISLSKFKSIRHLELQRVPPHLIRGLGIVAGQLEFLGVHRCLSSVQVSCFNVDFSFTHSPPSHMSTGNAHSSFHRWCFLIFQPFLDLADGVPFSSLTTLRLSQNLLSKFDGEEFLRQTPCLKYLDLSHNQIQEVSFSERILSEILILSWSSAKFG